MRKHVVIVSEESALAGHYKCGIGEVVDGLADALRQFYDVTLITVGTRAGGRIGGTITVGEDGEAFLLRAAEHVNMICPDLVHNFAHPRLSELLHVEGKKILSFDRWEDVADAVDVVPQYDHVVAMSEAYAAEVLEEHPEAAAWPMRGIIAGIDGSFWPKGSDNPDAKQRAKQRYYRHRQRTDPQRPMVLSMGRLVSMKGVQDIIHAARGIALDGADLVVYGVGEPELEQQLQALHDVGVLTYHRRMGGYFEMLEAIQAADFFLMPSHSEVCGLMPMKAARMGAVPIVRPVGGLGENFNETNAVLITDTVRGAVQRALQLREDQYARLRTNGMEGAWTWSDRVLPYVELYGPETAPTRNRFTVRSAVPVTPEP